MPPSVALLVHNVWAQRIVDNEKVWEIRNKPTNRRGRICIACTKNSTPELKPLILGEATLIDCFKVFEKRGSFITAPAKKPSNFLFLKKNIPNHRITGIDNFLQFENYTTAYAWVLKDAVRYAEPQELKQKRGQIVWAKLS